MLRERFGNLEESIRAGGVLGLVKNYMIYPVINTVKNLRPRKKEQVIQKYAPVPPEDEYEDKR